MNRTSLSNPVTQHPGHDAEEHRSRSQNGTTNAPFSPPLMIPQLFNPPYYWPYSQMIYFLPFPAMAGYYFQQPMMGIPLHAQPTPFGVPPIAQNINTGQITNNFVTIVEIGTNNSSNVKIKNGNRALVHC